MKQRILVTGGSGFIGTNLIEYLISEDKFEVLNLDLHSSPLEYVNKITSICDLRDLTSSRSVIVGFNPDYIIHLAARTDLDGRELADYSSNIAGVANLMEIAKELESLKKIIVTSSMLVCKAGYMPIDQDDYSPTTLYGESKVNTELITKKSHLACDWSIIRPTSIWGPWFKEPYRNFFDRVRTNQYFHIGKKSCTKTYGYVGNAVYQILAILFADTSKDQNRVFYIGDPALNIEDWANEIAHYASRKIVRMPYPLIKIAALVGDALLSFGKKFPMTSFRLKNMTTNNVIDLTNTFRIAPNPPFSRTEGIKITLEWLDKYS